jgi:hypothetical protein
MQRTILNLYQIIASGFQTNGTNAEPEQGIHSSKLPSAAKPSMIRSTPSDSNGQNGTNTENVFAEGIPEPSLLCKLL